MKKHEILIDNLKKSHKQAIEFSMFNGTSVESLSEKSDPKEVNKTMWVAILDKGVASVKFVSSDGELCRDCAVISPHIFVEWAT